MNAKSELIAYLRSNDRYFIGKYLDDYPIEVLLKIKRIIESHLTGLPKGYMLYSNGYDDQMKAMEIPDYDKK